MARTVHEAKRNKLVRALMVVYDAAAVNAAYFLALLLRYYVAFTFNAYALEFVERFKQFAPLYTVGCLLIFYVFRLYHAMWEFGGLRDLNRVLTACIVTSLFYVAGTQMLFGGMPKSYYLLGAVIQFLLIAISRFAYRLYRLERDYINHKRNAADNVMVIGVGRTGQFARNQIEQDHSMKIVCIVDGNGNASNRYLNGVPVVAGFEDLPHLLQEMQISYVILADESLSKEDSSAIKKLCGEQNIAVQDIIAYLQSNNESDVSAALTPNANGKRTIPFSPPDITDLEISEVKRALKSGWITTGPRTKELERKLAEYCHTTKVVCLNSATAAEELNLRICGIGPGDEVILPAYTYTATASAVIHCGATVIFIDSQKDNWEMDYDKVAAAITERTKAIVAVDLGGIVVNYDKLFAIAESKQALFRPKQGDDLGARIQQATGRVLVFADCAHALGAQRHGKKAGGIADFTSFSFHAVKSFTTAEGGAATWRDIPGVDPEEIYHQYQLYSLHGQNKDALSKTKPGAWEYDVVGPWYKCNMTDIMASIGLKQLERYDGLMARRHEIIRRYDAVCDKLGVMHLTHRGEDFLSSGHLYITRVPGIDAQKRQEIIVKMAEAGVATNVHYKPLPMMTAYKDLGWDIKDFPHAYDYYHNLITLPLHTRLTDEDVQYVIETYSAILKAYMV